jgi:hypothetical protein
MERMFACADEWLFTENETNCERLFDSPSASPYVKDAFHRYVVNGDKAAVNPASIGTKAAAHFVLEAAPGEAKEVWVRFKCGDRARPDLIAALGHPFLNFERVFKARLDEADEFYAAIQPEDIDEDSRRIQRQAFAGLLWSKQFYHYGIDMWYE